MQLERLEIRNYRSIKSQVEDEDIQLEGLDCLVGENNAGKSNILRSIKYLLGEGDTSGEEIFYDRDESRTVEVRGFFSVSDTDLERISDEEKREEIEKLIRDGVIGLSRDSDNGLRVLKPSPDHDRLNREKFREFHSEEWGDKETKTTFRDNMLDEYPELENYLRPDKKKNKTEWPRAYDLYVQENPDDLDLDTTPDKFPSGTKTAIRDTLLPKILDIPAVKKAEETAENKRKAEFSELITALSQEIQEELDEQIEQQMGDVLEEVGLRGSGAEGRHTSVERLEDKIERYISETFDNYSVSLKFGELHSGPVFNDAKLKLVETDGLGEHSIDIAGEGVKRVLIFSLIRTLADLQTGEFSLMEDEQDDQGRPFLILYEEAELFLHPGLQRILLRAFDNLQDSGQQVIFSTHSPFLIDNEILTTINLVKKDENIGTRTIGFHQLLEEQEARDKRLLSELQNVSSYIFSDKVVLVEGPSDKIVLKKLARGLDDSWNFEESAIPVLPVMSKHNLSTFKDFLEDFGIEVFVMADIDAVKETVEELVDRDTISQKARELREKAEAHEEDPQFRPTENSDFVSDLVDSYDWSDVFDRLRDLRQKIREGEEPEEDELGSLERLINKKYDDAWENAIISDVDEIKEVRNDLRSELMDENVLLLEGTIEDYYDASSNRNKVEQAIEFDEEAATEISSTWPLIEGEPDIEVFLQKAFAD